jgi:hypothetical protein
MAAIRSSRSDRLAREHVELGLDHRAAVAPLDGERRVAHQDLALLLEAG